MNRATLIVVALVAAFVGGTVSAGFALANLPSFTAQKSGSWQRLPSLGSANTNPYSKAVEHLSNQLPMGGAEGQTFIASTDDNNLPLLPQCNYRIEGDIPSAKLFTLHAETLAGEWIVAKAPLQSALHSDNMLFNGNTYSINVAASAQPGNWLALNTTGPFQLALTYYDVAVINDDTGNSTSLPLIKKESCSDA